MIKKEKKRTIAKAVSLEGIGLHTGLPSKITFRPASENYGIKFIRVDLQGEPEVPALIDYVKTDNTIDSMRGTNLELDGVNIYTIEHVLAAVTGLQIDNIRRSQLNLHLRKFLLFLLHRAMPCSMTYWKQYFQECDLTHNQKRHDYNMVYNPLAEDDLWTPETQEHKTSQYGGKNLRYKIPLKRQYINQFKELHNKVVPWNKIRYIF